MSSDFAIRVKNLSKCFHIYDKPRDRLKQALLPRARRVFGKASRAYHRDFWALKDVNLEIQRGETFGVIGRNGSGKSTLLQMLCGTLTPTSGEIEVNGKVAALLELGAGFNPEFTGRENVFLSASFYGLSREETARRFEAIAAFADIGDHIEQPVKTYSSGMFVRLAFAVIAHVDADILIVDEALSVGDAVFTQKCMRFIRSFQEHGTLLFVSHDMPSVINLCRSAIWLGAGHVKQVGPSKIVAEAYLKETLQEVYGDEALLRSTHSDSVACVPDTTECVPESDPSVLDYGSTATVIDNLNAANGWKSGGGEVQAVHIETLSSPDAAVDGVLRGGETVRMCIRARANKAMREPILGFMVRDRLGQDLFGENTLAFTHLMPTPVDENEEFEAEFVFRMPMLPNGQYAVMASVAEGTLTNNIQHHYLHDALIINVSSSDVRWGLVGVHFENAMMTRK
nr:ABC transporter ATP-binding protein [uncultured Cupriavidus sp.]